MFAYAADIEVPMAVPVSCLKAVLLNWKVLFCNTISTSGWSKLVSSVERALLYASIPSLCGMVVQMDLLPASYRLGYTAH